MKRITDKYVCEQCSKETVTPHDEDPADWVIVRRFAKHDAHLCSVECHYKWAKALKEGKDEPIFAGGEVVKWQAGRARGERITKMEITDSASP